jgi:hypothetical protein
MVSAVAAPDGDTTVKETHIAAAMHCQTVLPLGAAAPIRAALGHDPLVISMLYK